MTNNSPEEILEVFEDQDKLPNKRKKKKSTPKKSDHKHIYENLVLKEEFLSYMQAFPSMKDKKHFRIYNACSICNKLDYGKFPDRLLIELNEFRGSPIDNTEAILFHSISITNEEIEFIKKNFPEISICYLEK